MTCRKSTTTSPFPAKQRPSWGPDVDRVRDMVGGQPRPERHGEPRLLLSLPLLRVNEVVCGFYEIERQELSRRWSRHLARAALACLAPSRTMATMLGLPRGEYMPALT